MNPDNTVVQLCAQGMAAETDGGAGDARRLFEQAWDAATDDYEGCVAAHYFGLPPGQPAERPRVDFRQDGGAQSYSCK